MPMLLDRDGEVPDRWTVLSEDDPLPSNGAVIVSLERLDEAMSACPGLRVGLTLPNDAGPEPLAPRFSRMALIRVIFPSFSDGRGFSLARRLRSLGFGGRLRAAGPVIAVPFGHLLAVGFDEVEVADEVARRQPAGEWLAARDRISRFYQRRPDASAIAEARLSARG